MRCNDCEALLTAFIDRELSPDEKAAVEDHLASCPSCVSEHTSLALASMASAQMPAIEPDSHLWIRIRAEIQSDPAGSPVFGWWPEWLPHPWAAASFVAGFLVLILGLTLWPSPHPLESSFSHYFEKRERAFQEQRQILFRHDWADQSRQARNPFSQPLTHIDYNPFQE